MAYVKGGKEEEKKHLRKNNELRSNLFSENLLSVETGNYINNCLNFNFVLPDASGAECSHGGVGETVPRSQGRSHHHRHDQGQGALRRCQLGQEDQLCPGRRKGLQARLQPCLQQQRVDPEGGEVRYFLKKKINKLGFKSLNFFSSLFFRSFDKTV